MTIDKGMFRQAHRDRTSYRKLTEEGVREIRELRASGMTLKAIADQVGLGRSTVGDVVSGLRWGDVK